jgi:exopolysaccharide biosynthesis polyprenyl glycosylphosphotransferase
MIDDRVTSMEHGSAAAAAVDSLSPVSGAQAEHTWKRRLLMTKFRLEASERKLLLAVMDVGLLIAALIIAIEARTDWLNTPTALFDVWRWYVALALVWWVVSQLLECYDLARAAVATHSILAAASAAAITTIVYQMIPLVTPPLASRGLSVLFGVLAVGFISLWRGIYAVLIIQPNFEQRALVVGAGQAGQSLLSALAPEYEGTKANPFRGTGYRVIGFVDDDPAKQAEGEIAGVQVVGGCEDLVPLARQYHADEVVVAITRRHTITDCTFKALLDCREQGIRVTTMAALYEKLLGRVPVEHIGRNLTAILPSDEESPAQRLFWVIKRLEDLALASMCLLILAILILPVWLANRLWSPGPLFYRQTRMGKGGHLFSVVKFRTMRPDAEKLTGAVWSARNDPRITPVGQVLRRTRLDELPQVINVLRGEMSMIGPRPERPEFIERLSEEIPYYRARHAVKPGLTGWAQVRYGYGNSVMDSRVKLEYDLYYVRHAGFYLDMLITLKTVGVMLRLQGK